MNTRDPRLLRRVLAALILVASIVCIANAGWAAKATMAPLNPAFVDYLEKNQSGPPNLQGEGEFAPGFIPPPLDIPYAKSSEPLPLLPRLGFPATYDLRSLGKLTSVKNQANCGSCWAFATYGCLESGLMPTENLDFSENHLKNLAGYDFGCCDGGNTEMSLAYMARWEGPVYETDDPYNTANCTSPAGLTPRKHIQECHFLPNPSGPLDNDAVKQAVMSYGAVYTAFYWNSAYYNTSTGAYYYSGSAYSNHAVCIVGWDDNYSRTNFLTQPPGDGAFILKNSWGTSWGLSGYFYMSYYDSHKGEYCATYPNVQATDNYTKVYQYDRLGQITAMGFSGNTGWMANVFTATANEKIAAVSFYALAPNTTCEIRIYADPTSGPINPAGPLTTQTGTCTYPGYYTIALDVPVAIANGHTFSAVVKLTTPGVGYSIPIEIAIAGYTSAAQANPGESWVSPDGVSWTDITAMNSTANVCLKTFAVEIPGLEVSPLSPISFSGQTGALPQPASGTYTLTNHGSEAVDWSAAPNRAWLSLQPAAGTLLPGQSVDVTVWANNTVTYLGPGDYSASIGITNLTESTVTNRTVNLSLAFSGYLPVELSTVKKYADGAGISFTGSISTYALNTGWFYVEAPNRSGGIIVNKVSHGVTVGKVVAVTGTMKTNSSGERYVLATMVVKGDDASVRPLLLSNRNVGGSDKDYDPVLGLGQQGIKGALGLNNIGMLVSTFGRVTAAGTGYFYLNDGSMCLDSSGNIGIKVFCTGMTVPALDKHVKLTGISSCVKSGTDLYRIIRARTQADIVVVD